ncbi:hypothetical protein GW933_02240 [Candidatus Falkowbacteria bacterium]|uniref:Uncharacterized protein n=1 Tax=Candidatus Buchananbacteria bacterium CG10_big_fil_rev_8_21_14_0_10_33_19 TaxID=1974525 RepID=A0A2H0W3X6_9BACT|nr:hypothetical protein [Candidatus Falkowbacteria bacterium]PIS06065.1 MAG: hypothetical protein COT80_04860 [Candidatus Buchananbacteria bacterium CG10_big_fil_rev_8_21_14_0_10_33_19]
MPISQITRTHQIEVQPQPEKVDLKPERESKISPEMPQVEFGNDQLSEQVKQDSQVLMSTVTGQSPSDDFVVNERFKKIESILEEDLSDIYFNLTPQKQHEFKVQGEETTSKIMALLARPKIQVKKIVTLIRDWLKVIPGINVFFLEQMVKIKTDKIINESSNKK